VEHIPYQSEKKKELALLVHGQLFSEFYTRQGSQPLLVALAGQPVNENNPRSSAPTNYSSPRPYKERFYLISLGDAHKIHSLKPTVVPLGLPLDSATLKLLWS